MKQVDLLRAQLAQGEFEFSRHAFKRAAERNISESEIRDAGASAILIENYPADRFSPSCLLRGVTNAGRVLHIQVSRADVDLVKIITLYEPSADDWDETFSRRRQR